MKDRVPLHPGRVTMTPVPGQANTYDMVRADQPTEAGDALNKANLLPDDVCAALGIPTTSVPKDALIALSTLKQYVVGVYTGTGNSSISNPTTISVGFNPSLMIILPSTRTNYGICVSDIAFSLFTSNSLLLRTYSNGNVMLGTEPSGGEITQPAYLNSNGVVYKYIAFK